MKEPTAWDNFLWGLQDWIADHEGFFIIIFFVFLLCFVAGDADAEDVVPEYENTNVLLKINWFDTTKELQELLTVRNEEDFYDTAAYSECEVHYEGGDDIGFCEIWVVRPKTVDKEHTKSIGHEVLHGVLGDYHKK